VERRTTHKNFFSEATFCVKLLQGLKLFLEESKSQIEKPFSCDKYQCHAPLIIIDASCKAIFRVRPEIVFD